MKGSEREVRRGQSYYSGDGLNKALVRPEKVEAVLKEVLAGARRPHEPVEEPESRPILSLVRLYCVAKDACRRKLSIASGDIGALTKSPCRR